MEKTSNMQNTELETRKPANLLPSSFAAMKPDMQNLGGRHTSLPASSPSIGGHHSNLPNATTLSRKLSFSNLKAIKPLRENGLGKRSASVPYHVSESSGTERSKKNPFMNSAEALFTKLCDGLKEEEVQNSEQERKDTQPDNIVQFIVDDDEQWAKIKEAIKQKGAVTGLSLRQNLDGLLNERIDELNIERNPDKSVARQSHSPHEQDLRRRQSLSSAELPQSKEGNSETNFSQSFSSMLSYNS
mmetsp:Transcript_3750/g.5719  ORF Transcript_3750/g.5719 Transcript_3750/m.5719 type:complete len:244 (+) Transcript_3750:257-988(+)